MTIEPAGFGDNLNRWFRVLGRNWKSLLLIAVVGFVPLGIAIAITFTESGAADAFTTLLDEELVNSMRPEDVLELFAPFFWVFGVWIVVQLVVTAFAYPASAKVVVADLTDRSGEPGDAISFGWKRLPASLATMALVALVMVGVSSLVALLIVGVFALLGTNGASVFFAVVIGLGSMVALAWLGLRISLSVLAVAVESAAPVAAISRSFELTRGRWWITFGFVVLTGLITSAGSQVVGLVLAPLYILAAFAPVLFGLLYGLVAIAQGPAVVAASTALALWYVDLLARNEELDNDDLVRRSAGGHEGDL